MSLPYDELYRHEPADAQRFGPVRASIVLHSSTQWRTWYSQIQTVARGNDVWEYLDPEVNNPPSLPKKPVRPDKSEYEKESQTSDKLSKKGRQEYQDDRKEYETDLAEYNTLKRAIDRVTERIRNSLAPEL
jgi:hypothetical protein